ncbi:MAG: TonB-dependent receptor [Pseudomonadota bacterium]
MTLSRKRVAISLAAALASQTGVAMAQQLEEIVVTASKRAENLQDVPQAITAFSQERLREQGIVETSDLMGSVPNIQVTSAYGRTQPNFSIRGISVANEFSAATASPVGVYVDEVYQSFRAAHGQQLYDLEGLEVLRGPQGTLYGRNTTGGAVNVNTVKPSLEEGFTGFLNGRVGNFSTTDITGAIEATVIPDVLGFRLAGAISNADGYVENTLAGTEHPEVSSEAARLSMLWRPTERTEVHAKVYWAENDPRQDIAIGAGYLQGATNGAGVPLVASPDLTRLQSDSAGTYFTSSEGISVTIKQEINDSWAFTGIFGYDEAEYRLSPFECDGSFLDVCAIRYFSESESYNIDLRVDYTGEKLRFIGGFYNGEDEIFTANEPDFFGFLQPLLTGAGLPGEYFNPAVAVGNSIGTLPLFAVDPSLDPTDPANCAPVVVNPNGYFDARSLIAFNTDVALTNSAGGTAVQGACAAAGAPPFANIDVDQEFTLARPSTAIYGEVVYDVSDAFSLMLGLRYTWDDVEYKDAASVIKNLAGTPVAALVPYIFDPASVAAGTPLDINSIPRLNQDESTSELTGRIVAEYRFNDDTMVYGSYAAGYRAGTYNALAYQDVSQVFFVPPETVDAFEAGIKTRMLDNTLQLNAAAFFYDYAGQQIAQIVGATSFLRSADGEVFGAEAELSWQASADVLINASIGFLETEYDDQQLSEDGLNIGGNEFPNAPNISGNISAQWRAWSSGDADLVVYGEAQYMGEYWFDPFNDYNQSPCDAPAPGQGTLLASPELACQNPSYWLFNARVAYNTDNYSIAAWARNIADEGYYTYGLNLNAFFQDYLVRGMPRTYGLEFRYNF